MKHVITILADGFEEIEAITVIDLLRRAEIKVTILGLDSLEINGAHDVIVHADNLLDSFDKEYDGIILPGGMPGTTNLANSSKIIDLVKSSFNKGLLCAAICAAPSVLGKAGILEGKKAVCFPGFESSLHGSITTENKSVIKDANIITSRGPGTAIPFSLEIISYLKNSEFSDKIKTSILY
ncbi:MAG: DJ-1/PfpI family protein [Fibrobacter sp.]|nr:DJ-1/PfpI family protein [Fibrobacter sp.]